jgi:hypothetical protein
MVVRIWHGWTSTANANRYEDLLREEIFVGISRRSIAGYHGIKRGCRGPAQSASASGPV